ncbi:hypothetical protein K432DRAFT_411609 [Lepidopterella palustris CBS 459.81]|uniref:Uncharacterized protein n=1 Tax=Lepidopterella palustris CBS 459.81 TaxID=1314670 RepID=A0A8E2J7V5_9PEZI|nr:hypothetical protein K432DRAFT_411609 [Lepidopterella palustris CBS 459.81]
MYKTELFHYKEMKVPLTQISDYIVCESEVIRRYNTLKKPPISKNIENWLKDWEIVYNKAAALDLLDITMYRP